MYHTEKQKDESMKTVDNDDGSLKKNKEMTCLSFVMNHLFFKLQKRNLSLFITVSTGNQQTLPGAVFLSPADPLPGPFSEGLHLCSNSDFF